ncbi:MAG: hypothetical protein HUJ56_05925 [Erysipelotrichaceae bacterium]|nr:hypothetical protein [Erysipelotrichaceae bacterium]
MTRTQILNKFGKELTRDEIASLKEAWKDHGEYHYYGHTYGSEKMIIDSRQPRDEYPGYPTSEYGPNRFELIPVYEVEWLEVDSNFVMQRY